MEYRRRTMKGKRSTGAMKKFKKRGGMISSHLSEYEVELLTNLVDQLLGMLAEEASSPADRRLRVLQRPTPIPSTRSPAT